MNQILTRLSEPGYLDHAEYGTMIKVVCENNHYDLYRQTSQEEDKPIWVHHGRFEEDIKQDTAQSDWPKGSSL